MDGQDRYIDEFVTLPRTGSGSPSDSQDELTYGD